MNTETDTQGKAGQLSDLPNEWDELGAETKEGELVAPSAKIIDSASSLSDRLSHEIDERKEERFYWIFGVSILLDIIMLPGLSVAVAGFVCALQIIFLIGMAHKLGIDIVVKLLQNLLNKLKM